MFIMVKDKWTALREYLRNYLILRLTAETVFMVNRTQTRVRACTHKVIAVAWQIMVHCRKQLNVIKPFSKNTVLLLAPSLSLPPLTLQGKVK